MTNTVLAIIVCILSTIITTSVILFIIVNTLEIIYTNTPIDAVMTYVDGNNINFQKQIEEYLYNYYGMEQVLWVDEGIVGDDTDGHIDDTVRFVNEDTVITVVEENADDENHTLLEKNLKQL